MSLPNITTATWADEAETALVINGSITVPWGDDKSAHKKQVQAWVAQGGVISAFVAPEEDTPEEFVAAEVAGKRFIRALVKAVAIRLAITEAQLKQDVADNSM